VAKKSKDMSWLLDEEGNSPSETVDMNNLPLENGDSVIACKDLKVK
jgi:uncharacterized Zn ribbon protein